MHRKIRGNGPMVDVSYMPVMCNHCDNAPCMKFAGDGSIYKRPDGIVIMDPIRTKGRQDIVRSCPYKAISWNEERQVPQIWIFDAHLIDQKWKQPRCVQSCPTEAMQAILVDDVELKRLVAAESLEVRKPELGTRPRVFYRNMNRFTKCFIGGNIVAAHSGGQENVNGAVVRVLSGRTQVAEAITDAFGDFKIDGLDRDSGTYTVEAQHNLYGTANAAVSLGSSSYLGSLVLT
ncbi:MAG: 4Fe-4S dicluster domain-containing protein, partial [Rhodospirillales bacterium]|jgi:Fe-S-cluster-containing dehydrogenase component